LFARLSQSTIDPRKSAENTKQGEVNHMQHLKITIAGVEESPSYDEKNFSALDLKAAHIVERGTQQGNPTVDLLLVDNNGRQYVAVVTGNLLEMLGSAVAGVRARTNTN
jgi:hypothetical protein